ncbi:DUF2767 family protein [Salmonella enterica]|nr:DUF2767 family protein [Salmonella enterica]
MVAKGHETKKVAIADVLRTEIAKGLVDILPALKDGVLRRT